MTDFYDIQHLVNLFNPPKDDSDSDCDDVYNTADKPNADGQPKEIKPSPYSVVESSSKDETVLTNIAEGDEAYSEWRQTPQWDISYRQQVTASDVFLQVGAKTPATASCEDMIVTVHLPGEHLQNIDVKVDTNKLEVISPRFSLKIPLPQPVHPQKGDAKWDGHQEKLIITLKMDREFDFINF